MGNLAGAILAPPRGDPGFATLVLSGDGSLVGSTRGGTVTATAGGTLAYDARAAAAGYWLTYPPPVLTNPVTISVPASGGIGTLDNQQDYILVMPGVYRTDKLTIAGGRNVWVIGGAATLSSSLSCAVGIQDYGGSNGSVVQGRVVHIEGLLIDASGGYSHDGIGISAPSAIVQIQNCRITGLTGSSGGVHADCIQVYTLDGDGVSPGGCKMLRIERVTGTTDYQGFYWPPTGGNDIPGGVFLDKVNLSYWQANGSNTETVLYWLTDLGSCAAPTTAFGQSVWMANNRTGQTVQGSSVRPSITEGTACQASYDAATGRITWPAIANVSGWVNAGTPPNGDFCPVGNCGIGYVSPGYGPAILPGVAGFSVIEGVTNGLSNPGFESNTTGWIANGTGATISRDTGEHTDRDGNTSTASAKVVCDGTNTQQGIALATTGGPTVASGQTWTISFDVKGSGTPSLVIDLVERTSGGSFVISDSGSLTITLSSTWTRYSRTYTLSGGGTVARLQLRLRQTGSAGASTFYVDNVQYEQKGYMTPYAPTSRTGVTVSFDPTGLLSASRGTVAVRSVFANTPSGGAQAFAVPDGGGGTIVLGRNASNQLFATVGNATITDTTTTPDGTEVFLALVWNGSVARFFKASGIQRLVLVGSASYSGLSAINTTAYAGGPDGNQAGGRVGPLLLSDRAWETPKLAELSRRTTAWTVTS